MGIYRDGEYYTINDGRGSQVASEGIGGKILATTNNNLQLGNL